MTAYPVVYTYGVRKPGDVYQGCSPKPGNVLDAQGRLILVHRYGPPSRVPAPLSEVATSARGIRRGSLL